MTFTSLHPPIRVCGVETDTASLLSGGVSCQPDWFPKKEIPVGWLLFSKCTVAGIQAFEQILFVCFGKNGIILSLLHKNHRDLEFTTDHRS